MGEEEARNAAASFGFLVHLANVAKRTRCNATAVTALAAAPLAASATEEEPLPTAGGSRTYWSWRHFSAS